MTPLPRRRLALLSGLLALACVACARPAEPEFLSIDKAEVHGARSEGNLLVTAQARFYNPNRLGIDVTGLDVDLFVDDRQAATIRQHVEVSVPGRSEFTLPLEIEVPLRVLYEDVGSLLQKLFSEKKIMLRLDGKITVDLLSVEFRTPFVYEREYTIDGGS